MVWELQDSLDPLDSLAHLVTLEDQDLMEVQELQVSLDPLAHLDLLAIKVHLDLAVPTEPLVLLGLLDSQDPVSILKCSIL